MPLSKQIPKCLFEVARKRFIRNSLIAVSVLLLFTVQSPSALATDEDAFIATEVGNPLFVSPHSKPIAINENLVYVTNTPSDTVDVIDIETETIVARIDVGIDPVGLAIKPDGTEIWVANHVSDTVSVIDTDSTSNTYHHVIDTITDYELTTLQSTFDEPTGIAFASDEKAYVSLSPRNEIAIVDVESREVTGRLEIPAQDPRSITVRNNKLFVIPFESNNQTQLSGCTQEKIDGDMCTFDAVEHVFRNNNVLSLGYDADIVVNPSLPDSDLFVFDTRTDQLLSTMYKVGTLLYDITVDSRGNAFVAQTNARNDSNGKAGTQKHGMAEMENRAFLNQITRVSCTAQCRQPRLYDLEPVPPDHPKIEDALATPYGIQISDDDKTVFVTAAGSDKIFAFDPRYDGTVLSRAETGAVPRGIALESNEDGSAQRAWVYNAVQNSVSIVDVSDRRALVTTGEITLFDPTVPDVKQGRIVFNDANMSSTATFSCESCHPDAHTDQLIWVLATPPCSNGGEEETEGCTQVPPRLTMPVRGARDTAPYHWDGIPGDPFGGNNTANINTAVDPNCSSGNPEECIRVLIDGSAGTTMCDVNDCPTNDGGKLGLYSGSDRDALAKFVLAVPYPPGPERPITNQLSTDAVEGFMEFNLEKDCGTCHRHPFLVSTNTPGTGMDAPTWRGAYDRWMVTPQARLNIIDLLNIVSISHEFPEDRMWILGGATETIWQMVLEFSNGYSGTFGRQVTLNATTVESDSTPIVLDALEQSASEGAVILQGEGVDTSSDSDSAESVRVEFHDGQYHVIGSADTFTRSELLASAARDELVLTLTARAGVNTNYDYPQPGLWPIGAIQQQSGVIDFALLTEDGMLRMHGRHIHEGAQVVIDGRKVAGSAQCEEGILPNCVDEVILIQLEDMAIGGGMHFVQVQNVHGKFSNDTLFFNDVEDVPTSFGNVIESGGTFEDDPGDFSQDGRRNWQFNQFNGSVSFPATTSGLKARLTIRTVDEDRPWLVEMRHNVILVEDKEYTFCYQARADVARSFHVRIDKGPNRYQAFWADDIELGTVFRQFKHTFTADHTDISARVVFMFAGDRPAVELDNVGLYEGSECRAAYRRLGGS